MPVYLTPDQVTLLLPGISVGKLSQLRFNGKGPAFRKPTAKTVLYVQTEVIEWVESTMRRGTAG